MAWLWDILSTTMQVGAGVAILFMLWVVWRFIEEMINDTWGR